MEIIHVVDYKDNGKGEYDNKPHIHQNYWEIIQTFSSSGSMMLNNKIYPMLYGSVYLINSNYFHYSNPTEGAPYIRNKIIIHEPYLTKILENCHGEFIIDAFTKKIGGHYTPDLQTSQEIDRLFASIYNLFQQEKEHNLFEITIMIMQMLTKIVKSQNAGASNYSSTLSSILLYIDQHFATDITLESIAKHFFITKSYLCRLFKTNLNLTVMEYILLKRLIHAKMLLKSTDKSISHIAYESGFSSASYFSHIFKKLENMTPKDYKNLIEHAEYID